jgi:predicted aldo/keto reductase-like oxidoreductase
MSDRDDGSIDRRQFLQRSVATAVGLGAASVAPTALAAQPRVQRYSKLGATGIEIPDIGFGSGSTADPALVRYAFDRGISYFDTAEGYPMKKPGLAEAAIGQALAGKRNEVVIASKTVAGAKDRRRKLMRSLNQSLRRLRTDHIDIYFNHAVNDLERLKNPEWFEFVSKAKQQGKIRFTGISGHGGYLIECLDTAIDEGLVDVILAAHNFGQDPAFYEKFTKSFDLVANQVDLPRVLNKAHAKGIGTIAMKTLMGARLNDMRPHEWSGSTFAQAAFRWVLQNPDVDALIVSMNNKAQIDEYLGASGRGAVRRSDVRLLRRYAALQGAAYCRHGCKVCESSCESGVEISEVLRTRMYATDYRDPEMARCAYQGLKADASACQTCVDQPCLGACPAGLPVADMTRSTPALLGIS